MFRLQKSWSFLEWVSGLASVAFLVFATKLVLVVLLELNSHITTPLYADHTPAIAAQHSYPV